MGNVHYSKYIKGVLILSLILTACTMVLPWFSFDSNVHQDYYGYRKLAAFCIPFFYMIVYFSNYRAEKKAIDILFMEGALLANCSILAYTFLYWVEEDNIMGGFNLQLSKETVQPGYLIAAAGAAISFMLYQILLLSLRKRKEGA